MSPSESMGNAEEAERLLNIAMRARNAQKAVNDLGAGPPTEGPFEPSLPYAGTEGYSGTDTSRAQALSDATNGVASTRQRYVLINAVNAGERGVTVAELRDSRLHHGRVSGALSVLHKEGRLVRLTEVRDKCKVYVMPDQVNGRPTEPFGRKPHRASKEVLNAATYIEARLRKDEDFDALFGMVDTGEEHEALWLLVKYARGEVE